jgi:hypothetical protein
VAIRRRQERVDGDDRIATRTIFDHDRFAPLGRQLVGEQARRDIDTAARAERHDEGDIALRPIRSLSENHRA